MRPIKPNSDYVANEDTILLSRYRRRVTADNGVEGRKLVNMVVNWKKFSNWICDLTGSNTTNYIKIIKVLPRR